MKILVLEFLFNKASGLQACNFIKKRLQHGFFPVKFLKTPILKNICERLSLKRDINETDKIEKNCKLCNISNNRLYRLCQIKNGTRVCCYLEAIVSKMFSSL